MTVAKQALPYVPYLVPAAAPWVMPGLALLNGLERANRPGASGDPIAEFARGAMEEFARSTIAGPFIDTAASSISHNSANFLKSRGVFERISSSDIFQGSVHPDNIRQFYEETAEALAAEGLGRALS